MNASDNLCDRKGYKERQASKKVSVEKPVVEKKEVKKVSKKEKKK